MAAGLLFAAVGCGGDDDSGGGGDQTTQESTADDEASGEASSSDSGEASDEGVCAAVQSVDLNAAFDGQLEFGEANGSTTCFVPIVGTEGEGLVIKVTTAENYELKALYEDEGLPFEKLDSLGDEAFILNDADLNVLLADGTSVAVGVSAFWVTGSPPDPAVVKAGLIEIAEAVVASR